MARRTRAAARPREGAHQARRRACAATTRAALGAGGEGVPLRHGRRREAAGRALRWTIPAARLPLHVRPELRGRLPDLLIDGRRYRRPAPTPARPRRDVRIRLTSTTGEAADLQAPRRGRGLAGLDPPARRVRERVTRPEATYTSSELERRLELGTRAGDAGHPAVAARVRLDRSQKGRWQADAVTQHAGSC